MPAVRGALVALAALAAAPAAAVGLGPLVLDGVIDGPREGFTLDLYNPYPATTAFVVYAVKADDERPEPRVAILPGDVDLAADRARKVLVIADGLEVGETFRFRVCAERKTNPDGVSVHARVCSKISARRVG